MLAFGAADREHRRHHRRRHDPDPAADPRQCLARAQRARRDLLHHPGRQYRRCAQSRSATRRCSSASCAASRSSGPLQHLWLQTLIVAVLVLAIFVALDIWFARAEAAAATPAAEPIRVRGLINLALIAVIIGAILGSAAWQPGRRISTSTARTSRCRTSCAMASLVLTALASLLADARTSIAPPTASPGSRSRGRQALCRHLRLHHSGAGDAAGRPRRHLRAGCSRRSPRATARRTRPPISG